MSLQQFQNLYPQGKIPRNSQDYGKIFVCRRGCNTRTATYTEEFIWEDLYHGVEDIPDLVEFVQSKTKATRKRRAPRQESPDALYDDLPKDGDDDVVMPRKPTTPRKPRGGAQGTPRKSKPMTPTSQRK